MAFSEGSIRQYDPKLSANVKKGPGENDTGERNCRKKSRGWGLTEGAKKPLNLPRGRRVTARVSSPSGSKRMKIFRDSVIRNGVSYCLIFSPPRLHYSVGRPLWQYWGSLGAQYDARRCASLVRRPNSYIGIEMSTSQNLQLCHFRNGAPNGSLLGWFGLTISS